MKNDKDEPLLRRAIEVAREAREHGNHPFGAILADEHGNELLRAENSVTTDADCTGHAELNLVRSLSLQPGLDLAKCTLYASTEPCPMCAGAIFWSGIGRLVYGLSEEGLYAMTGDSPDKLLLSCRDVLASGGRAVVVRGPLLEDEARAVHEGFWKQAAGA